MDKLLDPNSGVITAAEAKQLGETLWMTTGLNKFAEASDRPNGQQERPFVSPLTWALFSAYTGAVMFPVAQLTALRTGLDGKILNKADVILEPIREALPECKDYIDKVGLSGLKHLVKALERKLLAQIALDLQGEASDNEAVKHAAKIVEAVDAAAVAMKPQPPIPNDALAEKAIERP
jgi:hypothetical protein